MKNKDYEGVEETRNDRVKRITILVTIIRLKCGDPVGRACAQSNLPGS